MWTNIKILILFMSLCHIFKIDCDKLKMYTISPEATTKITKERVLAIQPTKEIKCNCKK